MLKGFRTRLTIWFVVLFVLLYGLGGLTALFVFGIALNGSLDDELAGLISEIRPSIRFVAGTPTLKLWADRANRTHSHLIATIQLYDKNGQLLEEYGPPGINNLSKQPQESSNEKDNYSVKSLSSELVDAGLSAGYLQIEVPTKHRDEALHQFRLAFLVLAPFLAIAVFLGGYFFSGRAAKPLEETLILLRRFVADAGHELNTPISIIEASVETLETTLKDNDIANEILPVISRASKRMKDLAANLMLLAKTERAELLSPRTPVDLPDLVTEVLREQKEISKKKNVNLVANETQSKSILGHGESLHHLLSNLVSNAISYTDPGGTVTLETSVSDNHVIISIMDTGVGIPQEALPHIYDRFFRVDKSRSRAAGGSGLGLSIVKAIVDAHHGSIQAESQPGIGSKFTVTLPLK